jgi:hypothetical protein
VERSRDLISVTSAAFSITAPVEIVGINPFMLVPSQRATALRAQWRRPMPVLVRINGVPNEPWRTNLMPRGDGAFFLYLHGEMRKEANVDVGDVVTAELRFDESYHGGPTHEMPVEFQEALDANPTAKTNWLELPPSRRKEILRYFAGLKTDRAKERNVARAIRVLSGESDRFMARDWRDGR